MLRHYSTVRTSVVTIALPVCIGILGWVLNSSIQAGTAIVLLVAEFFLLCYALALSFMFSQRTADVLSFLMTLEADTHRPAEDPDASEGLLYSNVVSRALPFPPKLDPIDRTLVGALAILHIAFWSYYAIAVFPNKARPTDDQARSIVLHSAEVCGGKQVIAIRDLKILTPVVLRADVSCPSGPSTYFLEKNEGAWHVTKP